MWLALIALAFGADLDGAQVYRENCTRCHAARSPSELDAARWPAVVFHMRTRAGLTRAEMKALELFFSPPPAASPPWVLQNAQVATACTRCHEPQRIQSAVDSGRTREQWLQTLDRMATYGANVSPADREAIASWLANPPR